jgi:hypothetical protein
MVRMAGATCAAASPRIQILTPDDLQKLVHALKEMARAGMFAKRLTFLEGSQELSKNRPRGWRPSSAEHELTHVCEPDPDAQKARPWRGKRT